MVLIGRAFLSPHPKLLNGYADTIMTLAAACNCTAFVWFCCTSSPIQQFSAPMKTTMTTLTPMIPPDDDAMTTTLLTTMMPKPTTSIYNADAATTMPTDDDDAAMPTTLPDTLPHNMTTHPQPTLDFP